MKNVRVPSVNPFQFSCSCLILYMTAPSACDNMRWEREGCITALVVSWCFKVARRVRKPQRQMARGIFSRYVLYSWSIMGAWARLLGPERLRLTVSSDFNQHYTVWATSYSVGWSPGCSAHSGLRWISSGSSVSIYPSFTVRSVVKERPCRLDAQRWRMAVI